MSEVLAYSVQTEYRRHSKRSDVVLAVRLKYPEVDGNVIALMWQAIDAYVDMNDVPAPGKDGGS